MDILQPELIWVEGRCYRVNSKSSMSHRNQLPADEEETYEPDEIYRDEDYDESIEIEPYRGNLYKHSFYVNKFVKFKQL
jgi:activating signal cointegrator complex subunit 1